LILSIRKGGTEVAELVVIGYPNEDTAERVMEELGRLQHDMVVQLAGAATVVKDREGKLKVTSPTHATGMGAVSGGLWGLIIGLLFFVPIGGLLIGGALGALFGKMGDIGIKDEFKEQVRAMMEPGSAAVVMMFNKATPDKTLAALAPYGGKVLKTSLSAEAEQHIDETLAGRV
jgi:uncharacterized membrane protein